MRNIFGWLPIVKGTTPIAADIASVATDNITSTNLQSDKQQIDTKLLGYTVTESSAGITTLDVNSNHTQRTTGTTTHTYVLPVTSTLTLNKEHEFINDSTGIITIKASNTTSTVVEVQPGATVIVKCIKLDVADETGWKVVSFRSYEAYQNLISAASITMNVNLGGNAILTLGHNVVLTLSNLYNGAKGNIILTQGSSNYTFAISPTPYVYNNGSGVITPGSGNGTITIVSYTYDGTRLFINYHSPYTNS